MGYRVKYPGETMKKLGILGLTLLLLLTLLFNATVVAEPQWKTKKSHGWTIIETNTITIAFPANYTKPVFIWWITGQNNTKYIVIYQGIWDYYVIEKVKQPVFKFKFNMSPRLVNNTMIAPILRKLLENRTMLEKTLKNITQLREELGKLSNLLDNLTVKLEDIEGKAEDFEKTMKDFKSQLEDFKNLLKNIIDEAEKCSDYAKKAKDEAAKHHENIEEEYNNIKSYSEQIKGKLEKVISDLEKLMSAEELEKYLESNLTGLSDILVKLGENMELEAALMKSKAGKMGHSAPNYLNYVAQLEAHITNVITKSSPIPLFLFLAKAI